MKRPLKDFRPFGPLLNNDFSTTLTLDENYKEYRATLYLNGDVTQYSQEKAQFASFVKGAFRQYNILFFSYRGWTTESPFKGDKYLCNAKANIKPTDEQKQEMMRMINDKVVGLAASEFRVKEIVFEPKQQ